MEDGFLVSKTTQKLCFSPKYVTDLLDSQKLLITSIFVFLLQLGSFLCIKHIKQQHLYFTLTKLCIWKSRNLELPDEFLKKKTMTSNWLLLKKRKLEFNYMDKGMRQVGQLYFTFCMRHFLAISAFVYVLQLL